MDDAFSHSPHLFLFHRRPLRVVLIDDQVWLVLRDFTRLLGYPHPERLLDRLEPDQVRNLSLHLGPDGPVEGWLISESAAYGALVQYGGAKHQALRRWLAVLVVPTVRSRHAGREDAPRAVQMQWQRQTVQALDWQGQLWLSVAELPRVLRVGPDAVPASGWRRWTRRLLDG